MQTAPPREVVAPAGVPVIDGANIDQFLNPVGGVAPHALIFFVGHATPRPETEDVAIVLPELLRAFDGRLRGAVVAASDEDSLKSRFQVSVTPSLVVTRGPEPVGVLPKIQDWSVYVQKISAWLEPDAPALARSKPDGRVEFVYTQRR